MYEVWQAPDVVIALGTLLAGTGACAGAFVAGLGVNSWKSQQKWKIDTELARQILTNIYRYRGAVFGVQNPAIWSGESDDAMTEKDKAKEKAEKDYLSVVRVYEKRWSRITDSRSQLYSLLLEADVVWGKAFSEKFGAMEELEFELFLVVRNYLETQNPKSSKLARQAAGKRKKQKRQILYAGIDDGDTFQKNFEEAILPIEKYLREYLGGKNL